MSEDKIKRLDLLYTVVYFSHDGSLWSEPVIIQVDPQFAPNFYFSSPAKYGWHEYAPCYIAIPIEAYDCRFHYGDRTWWFEEIVAGPFEPVGKTLCQFENESRTEKDDRIARARAIVENLKPTAAGNSAEVCDG